MKPDLRKYHWMFLLMAFSSLLAGVFGGLSRMGWSMPLPPASYQHGAIMVGGFFGTLIALEKIIPLRQPIWYMSPILSFTSLPFFLIGQHTLALLSLVLAAGVFVVVMAVHFFRFRQVFTLLALIGALMLLTGHSLLLWERFYVLSVPWWIGFLFFVIVSERLELTRFLPVTKDQKIWLYVFMTTFALSLFMPIHSYGKTVAGASVGAVALWLLRFDLIRINLKKVGLNRFMAFGLLGGYIQLLLLALVMVGAFGAQLPYDTLIHLFFIGFGFSMIFAHGPVILPGILGSWAKPYHPLLYLPLVLLHISVLWRWFTYQSILPFSFWSLSGWLSVMSFALYFVVLLTCFRLQPGPKQQH